MLKENQKSKLLKLLASYSNDYDLLHFSDKLIEQSEHRIKIDKKKARGFALDAYKQKAKVNKLEKAIGNHNKKRVGITILNNGLFSRTDAKNTYYKLNNPSAKVPKTITGLVKSLKHYIKFTSFQQPLDKFHNVITLLYSYQSAILHALHKYYMTKGNLEKISIEYGLGGSKLKRCKYSNAVIDLYNQTYHANLSPFKTKHQKFAGYSAYQTKVMNALHDYYVGNMNSYQASKNNHLKQNTLTKDIHDTYLMRLYNRTFKSEPNAKLGETAQHYHARIGNNNKKH